MNLKQMRNAHLYLGVFFSPLLIFFIISGCLLTFELHEAPEPQSSIEPLKAAILNSAQNENSYVPPKTLVSMSQVHMHQRWVSKNNRPEPSFPFRILIVMMSVGLLVTTVLGIIMAFKYTKPWLVWLCLFLGTAIPCAMIWVGYQ
jgi:hypothetical protein